MNEADNHGARYAASDSELVEDLDLILSTLRHQLGNSVNAIKVTLDVLNQNFDIFDDRKKKEYIKRGFHLLARQQAILEAMKSYSRFDVRDRTEIPADRLWGRILGQVASRIEGTGIGLEEWAHIEPATVHSDLIALDKIFDCVLENALEALDGVAEPLIRLKGEIENGHYHVILEDNGCGMAKADLQRIRIPLFTTKPGKAGIGLSIAYKLVTRMGGRMSIESTLEKGTSVRISLVTG